MSSPPHPVPPQVGRLQQRALAAGVLGLVACGVGGFADPAQFFRSYLFAYLYWMGVGLGCLSIMMIHHVTGGLWGLVIRRILEAGSRTLLYAVAFFLPLALGLKHVYVWADESALGADKLLKEAVEAKEVGFLHANYLSPSFFLGRSLFYLAVWGALAYLLSAWSLRQDRGWDPRIAGRMRGLSGAGLVLMGLTVTFSSVDWAMSLDPRWFSTIYGVLFLVGQALSALSLVIALVAALGNEEPLSGVVSPRLVHDLGKLLLAFVMLWAYISISQFIIVWSGNLPEEIPWYSHRLSGGWQSLALLLVVAHFALPFVLLLSRDLKRNARVLGTVAIGIFFVRLLDLYWLVGPELHGRGGFTFHWLDVAAPVGLGGIWLALFASQLGSRPLLPQGDPELREALEGAHG